MIGERKIADPRIPTPENTCFSPFFHINGQAIYVSVNTEKIIWLLIFDYVCIPAAEYVNIETQHKKEFFNFKFPLRSEPWIADLRVMSDNH